jgi:hypothetical protein
MTRPPLVPSATGADALFRRARDTGLLRPGTDLAWARRVYYSLIHEAAHDRDALAARVVDTLLRGIGDARPLRSSGNCRFRR